VEQSARHYDELVQRLSTAILARDMGRDDLADSNVRAALELARSLLSGTEGDLLGVR
jgi:hypothetical protein